MAPAGITVLESSRLAIKTLRANKLRSSLTILGVCVGVVTVLAMVSVIQGLTKSFSSMIEAIGSNAVFVTKFDASFNPQRSIEERTRKELTIADADAIREEAKSVVGVSPLQEEQPKTVRYQEHQVDNAIILGVVPDYEFTSSHYVSYGRFVTELDVREKTNIAVVGPDIVKALFPDGTDPIGEEIRVDGRNYTIVGVMEPLGTFLGQSMDMRVLAPLSTVQKFYPIRLWQGVGHPESSFTIVVRPESRGEIGLAVEEIRDILRRRRQLPVGEKDDFGISTQDALLDIYNELTGATYLVLTAVAAVSLIIGGIGVMNIMMVSVTERTKEIGLRKAVGATKKNILLQFLIEAVALTGIGGLLGIGLGEVAGFMINKYSPLPAYIPFWAVIMGITVTGAVGLIFGLYPAWRAAGLDPIEALRFE